MKKKTILKELSVALFCILLSIIFLVEGIILFDKSSGYFNNLTIIPEKGVSGEWIISALNEENAAFSFAAWTEFKNEYVSDSLNTRKCETDIIAICGSSHCLLPFGKNLSTSDKNGCIAGSSIVEKLFGNHDAEGREILWNDNIWVIREIVKEPSDLLIVQSSKITDKTDFDKISVILPEGADKRLAEENFTSRYAITGKALRWDYLYGISWIKEMVPGKWSDFDSLEQNFKEYKKAVDTAKNTEKSIIEATGLNYRGKGYWFILSGIILLAVGSFWAVCNISVLVYEFKNYFHKNTKKYLHFFGR